MAKSKNKKQTTLYSYQSFYDFYKIFNFHKGTPKVLEEFFEEYEEYPQIVLDDIRRRLLNRNFIFFDKEIVIAEKGKKPTNKINIVFENDIVDKWARFSEMARSMPKIGIITETYLLTKLIERAIEKLYREDQNFRKTIDEIIEVNLELLDIKKI